MRHTERIGRPPEPIARPPEPPGRGQPGWDEPSPHGEPRAWDEPPWEQPPPHGSEPRHGSEPPPGPEPWPPQPEAISDAPGEEPTAGFPKAQPGEGPGPRAGEAEQPESLPRDIEAALSYSVGRSVMTAGFSAVLAAMLIFGSRLDLMVYAVVCFAIQALFVLAWTLGSRPPGPKVVATAGVLGAAGADAIAVISPEASLAPLGYVVAGTFIVGVIGQLVRGEGRARVTESIGSVAVVAVGVVALATPVLLARYPVGTEALLACMLAAGTALVVARLCDMVLRYPQISPQVPRGAPGVVLGAMLGTAVAGWSGSVVVGLTPGLIAVAGLVVAMAAMLADLGMVFADTGRVLAGGDTSRGVVRAILGPLVGIAVAAPAAYLLSVLMIVKDF